MVKTNPSKQHNLPQTNTMHTLKVATLNINGTTAPTKVRMIANFIRRHEIDLMLIQEATDPDTLNFWGYDTHTNIGTSMWGTAIVARKEMATKVVNKLPSGRAMAIDYNGMRIVNVYAPSGTARRAKGRDFQQ
jgi:exonuclease III